MNIFKNSLNISDLYYDENESNTSIVYNYLLAANDKFKVSKKQESVLNKYLITLQEKVLNILQSSSNIQKKLIKFNPNMLETFSDKDSEQFNKDFVFIAENVISPRIHFIIYSNDQFQYNFDKQKLKPDSKIIILYKQGEDFYPIFNDEVFVFSPDNKIIDILFSFYDKTINNSNQETYETNDSVDDPHVQEYTHIHVINEDDIVFEDFEDNLKIVYKNKDFNQTFSEDEMAIQIQNLLVMLQNNTNGNVYLELFKQNKQHFDALLSMKRIKVANVEKHVNDDMSYIDEYIKFKKNFSTKTFVKSIYHQTPDQKKHGKKLLDEHVFRNSMTSSFKLIKNDTEINDVDDCLAVFKKPDLDVIAKFYDISFTNSKTKLCKQLVSHNFIEDQIIEYYDGALSLTELKTIAQKYDIILSKSVSKSKVVKQLLHARAFKDIHDKKILSDDEISGLQDKYNIPKQDSLKNTYESLMYANLLNSYAKQNNSTSSYEDHVPFNVVLETELVNQNSIYDSFYSFKSLKEDQLDFHGFFQIGNIHDKSYKIFNISNYINILNNLKKFLPMKCNIVYNDTKDTVSGKIVSYEQNDNLLKIKANNSFVYYNLFNLKDNLFFVYTDLHDGYHFDKKHLDTNIFFEFDKQSYDEVVDIISFNILEYLDVISPQLLSLTDIENFLHKFDTTIDDLTLNDYNTLFEYVGTQKIFSESSQNINSVEVEESKKKSIHSFLQFTDENITDVRKMFNLIYHKEFLKIIRDLNIDLSKSHTDSNVKLSFKRNTGVLQPLPNRESFDSFKELDSYKKTVSSIIDENADILLTIRESESQMYFKNKDSVWNTYSVLMSNAINFENSVHEKEYFAELSYEIENAYNVHDSEKSFINSDPNVKHTSLARNKTQIDDTLSNILNLIGLDLSDTESNYIRSQASNKFLPILKVYKQQKTKSTVDNVSWSNYSLITIYAAFITLFAQYKYKVSKVFQFCKSMYSLEGYPMNDNEKSFINYISCILFKIFNKNNQYFQSEKYLSSQITAIIKLIFQQNKALKNKFDSISKRKHNIVSEQAIKDQTIKPFPDDKDVLSIESNLSKQHVLNDSNFSMYVNMQNDNIAVFDKSNIFQIICKKKPKTKLSIMEKIGNVTYMNIKQETSTTKTYYITDYEIDENIDDLISEYINNFKKHFGFQIDLFVKHIVLQHEKVSNFYFMFKLNTLFIALINEYPFFENKSAMIHNDISRSSINTQYNILSCFTTMDKVISTIFETEDIYSYLNTEMNSEKRDHFNTILKSFENFLNNIAKSIIQNNIDFEELRKKTDILREEEKQEKLAKYNNLEDDEMYIVMELEKVVGLRIDQQNDMQDDNDVDNEEFDVVAAEDDDQAD